MILLLVAVLVGAGTGPVPGAGMGALAADTGSALSAASAPCPTPADGDEAGADPLAPPAEVWVQGAVARAWDVDADCVVVEWPVGAPEGFEGEAALEGSGAGGRWTVAFPVDGRTRRVPVRTTTWVLTPVATRSLSRGSVLDPSDMEWQPGVQAGPVDREGVDITGWMVARPLGPGDALTPPAIRPPVAVKVGEVVLVTWNGTTVQARREGTALRTGAVGDTVDVRLGEGTRRRARITGSGMVELIRPGTPGRIDR